MTSTEYISWVQRSLNRLLGAGLITDGKDTELYRIYVKEFQFCYNCGTFFGEVDESTQNCLVKANHKEPLYIDWTRQSLANGGFYSKGSTTEMPSDAIRAFQAAAKLKVDGWMGAKTETALFYNVGLTIPGYYPGGPVPLPPDPVKERESGYLKNKFDPRTVEKMMTDWCMLYQKELQQTPLVLPDMVERQVTLGMLAMFQDGHYDYSYLNKANARAIAIGARYGQSVESNTLNARRTLLDKLGRMRATLAPERMLRAFKGSVKDLYLEIDRGIMELKYQVHNSGALRFEEPKEGKVNTYRQLDDWYEGQINNPRSIIYCWRFAAAAEP